MNFSYSILFYLSLDFFTHLGAGDILCNTLPASVINFLIGLFLLLPGVDGGGPSVGPTTECIEVSIEFDLEPARELDLDQTLEGVRELEPTLECDLVLSRDGVRDIERPLG